MKKSVFLALTFLLGFSAQPSFALEVTVLGPQRYVRTTGKPDVYTDTFPGLPEKAKLLIKSGACPASDGRGVAPNGVDRRVTSASVLINGLEVLRPRDLPQDLCKIEIPVILSRTNSISTELRGAPGTSLTVQIEQDIAAEAAAPISPAGGVVKVTNPSSPLLGCAIEAPAGAFASSAILSISIQNAPPLHPLPDGVTPDGPVIALNSTVSSFQGPVYLTMPFAGPRQTDETRLLLTHNANTGRWETVPPLATADSGVLTAPLWHFSDYRKGKATIASKDISTSFKVGTDSLRFRNNGFSRLGLSCKYEDPNNRGVCDAVSLLSADYFNQWPSYGRESLMCHWSEVDAANASCEAFGRYSTYMKSWDAVWDVLKRLGNGLGIDYSDVVDFLKFSAKSNVATPLVLFADIPDPSKPGKTKRVSHAVVAIGWHKTDDRSGYLRVYNVNNNAVEELITWGIGWPVPVTALYYVGSGTTWTSFAIQPRARTSETSTAFASVARSMPNLCPPPSSSVTISTLGPDNAYNMPGFSIYPTIHVATAVSVPQDFVLRHLDVAVGAALAASPTESATFELRADAGGVPGTLIETWVFTGFPGPFESGIVQGADSLVRPLLSRAQQYWLVGIGSNASVGEMWRYAHQWSSFSAAMSTSYDGGGSWVDAGVGIAPAYRMQGDGMGGG